MKYFLYILILFVGSSSFALIAPPYVVQNEFESSLGLNPCFQVKKMEWGSAPGSNMKMIIQACDRTSGEALANLMNSSYSDERVDAVIVDAQGNPIDFPTNYHPTVAQEIADLTKVLEPTKVFSHSYEHCAMGPGCGNVVVEFKPTVLRVFFDDIGLPDGNHAFLAADLFRIFLNSGGEHVYVRTYTGY